MAIARWGVLLSRAAVQDDRRRPVLCPADWKRSCASQTGAQPRADGRSRCSRRIPGHDWHYKVMTQSGNMISPVRWLTPGAVEDSSSMWEDSMAAEGWGLYSEALMAEPQPKAPHGFYTPEEHLYQLRGKLYRDLRVRLDTGLHTGRIAFDDAVTQFSEVADFLPGKCDDQKALVYSLKRASCVGAAEAINRYARWPTQAITYRLGRDQIVALREKAQAAAGERFSAQRFHIEFMKQGTIPAGYFADELEASLARSRPR